MHFSLYSLTYISYTMRSTRTLWRFYWIRCHSCIRSSFIDPYTSFLVCLCTWFLYITSSLFKSILVCAPWHLKPFIQEIVEIDKWFLAAKLDFQRSFNGVFPWFMGISQWKSKTISVIFSQTWAQFCRDIFQLEATIFQFLSQLLSTSPYIEENTSSNWQTCVYVRIVS